MRRPDEICTGCGKIIRGGIAHVSGDRILCTPCRRKEDREKKHRENEQKYREAQEQIRHAVQSFHSKIAGTTHEGRQSIVRRCRAGDKLVLIRDANNRFSRNAIAIYSTAGKNLGWVTEDSAITIAPIVDSGGSAWAEVTALTGGQGYKTHYGVNIEIFYIIEPPKEWKDRQAAMVKSTLENRSGCLGAVFFLFAIF